MGLSKHRRSIQTASDKVIADLRDHVASGGRLCIIKAPPGSGKTYTLLEAIGDVAPTQRIAVAAQTNAQCDDICNRYVERYPDQTIVRFSAQSNRPPDDLDPRITWLTKTNELPHEPCVVVGTTAKWSTIGDFDSFELLFVDEAWQMSWADFMLLGRTSARFVLIGDPGQIPPVVSIAVERWETSPRAPHRAAPDLILEDPGIGCLALELAACRRLPAGCVDLVRPFYDFEFDAWAEPNERYVKPGKRGRHPVDPALDALDGSTSAILTLPTPVGGPPLELDAEIAQAAADIAVRALERKCTAASDDGGKSEALTPADIGIAATHRIVNSKVLECLPAKLRNQESGIRVDTPERWQGLERKFMVVVHPLSGVVHPSEFDLETGRLCVMASRHRSGMVIVTRDHVPETLSSHIPWAEQAVGRPDISGRGHHQHSEFWHTVDDAGGVVGAKA